MNSRKANYPIHELLKDRWASGTISGKFIWKNELPTLFGAAVLLVVASWILIFHIDPASCNHSFDRGPALENLTDPRYYKGLGSVKKLSEISLAVAI